MVMRLVRDDDVREDGRGSQGIAATGVSRPRRRSRPVTPPGPEQLQMGTDEQLDVISPSAEDDGASDRAEADAQETEPQEQPDGAVAAVIDDDAVTAESGDDSANAEAAPAVSRAAVEALLLSTHHPLTPARLGELLNQPSTRAIRRAVQELNEQYASTGRCFRIEQVAGGYQILTLPEFGDILRKLHQKEGDAKLTKAALETLSIIAYKQPILRADVEAIRGVACGETIRSLMEKHLVKIAGRAEEPGRPILYGTTRRFLELFGLNSLKDLPQPESEKKQPQG
jgi:segregation and condensation protein B